MDMAQQRPSLFLMLMAAVCASVAASASPVHGGEADSAAAVAFDNLHVEPIRVRPGQPVEISVEATNETAAPAEAVARLYVNAEREETRTVSLEAGQTQTVTFSVRRDEPGAYHVQVNDLRQPVRDYSREVGSFATSKFPRARRAGRYTFYGYVNGEGDITIKRRSRDDDAVETAVLGSVQSVDDHAAPYIYIDAHNHVLAWWYDRQTRDTIHQARSTEPLGMAFAQSSVQVDRVDYPVAFEDDGGLYLIYRSSHGRGQWEYLHSDDGGESWSEPRLFFDGTPWPYLHTFEGERGVHIVRGGQTFHSTDFDVYYVYLEGGRFYAADGSELGSLDDLLPLGEADMEVVQDADDGKQRAMEVVEHASQVYVLLASNITEETGPDGNYTYERAAFSEANDAWVVEQVAQSRYGGPGELSQFPLYATMNQQNPAVVYASVYRPEPGQVDIGTYSRVDGGWEWAGWITDSPADDIIPQAVRGADDELLWHRGDYITFTDFDTRVYGATLQKFMVTAAAEGSNEQP